MQEVYEGSGENRKFVGYIKKYKIADKKGALDSLGKHLGLFEANGRAQEGGVRIVDDI